MVASHQNDDSGSQTGSEVDSSSHRPPPNDEGYDSNQPADSTTSVCPLSDESDKNLEFHGHKISFILDREDKLWILADDVIAHAWDGDTEPDIENARLPDLTIILTYMEEDDKKTYSTIEKRFTNIGPELEPDTLLYSGNAIHKLFRVRESKSSAIFIKWLWNDFLPAVGKFKECSLQAETQKELESLRNHNEKLREVIRLNNDTGVITQQDELGSEVLKTLQSQQAVNTHMAEYFQKLKESNERFSHNEVILRILDVGLKYYVPLVEKLNITTSRVDCVCQQPSDLPS